MNRPIITGVRYVGLYAPEPEHLAACYSHPIDLSQPEAVLRQDIADLMAQFKVSKGGSKWPDNKETHDQAPKYKD